MGRQLVDLRLARWSFFAFIWRLDVQRAQFAMHAQGYLVASKIGSYAVSRLRASPR